MTEMSKFNRLPVKKYFIIVEWNQWQSVWWRDCIQSKIIINEKEIDLLLSISSIWRFRVCLLYKKIAFWLRILKFKRNCMKRFNFLSPGANQLKKTKSFNFFLIRYLYKSIEMLYLCVIFIYLLYQIIIIKKFAF